MEVSIEKHKFLCVEYPGVVHDEEKMLKTLGGEDTISQVFKTKGQRLELRYRPDDIYCKPTCANKYSTASLLLKVRRVKKDSRLQSSGHTEYEYSGDVIGIVDGVYKFTNLADFQYLPMSSVMSDSGCRSLRDDLSLDRIRPLSWIKKSNPLHLPPTIFSRIDSPSDYYYRDGITSNLISRESASDPNSITAFRRRRPHFTHIVMFETPEIPTTPHQQAVRKVNRRKKIADLLEKVAEKFKERPIWTRMALAMNMDYTAQYLKTILPAVAYYMLTGPWRRVWIRFGYDPRTEPGAKIYQVVDFRIKDKQLSQNLGINIKRSSTGCKLPNMMTKAQTTVPKIKQSELRTGDFSGISEGQSQAEKETECTEKDGWCRQHTTEMIRKIIFDHLSHAVRKQQTLDDASTSSHRTEQEPVPGTSSSLADESTNRKGLDDFMGDEEVDEEDLNTEEEEMMEEDSSDEEEEETMEDG
ncbi:hypothetical protein LSH36_233g01012 [Paralvinella palmiformis]|uniref:Uncharacterized protein n=1 Tax=Paralvinella palmiformis TaxID=53620 RepID=A0AAD9N5F3_9ANNE|nr:hypothetical protein LSH36_233g01012 [Paralvinella palmiformis]